MGIDFSEKDILLIYGNFMKKINELNKLKDSSNNSIHISSINQDIKLFSSITSKIEETYPKVIKLAKHF